MVSKTSWFGKISPQRQLEKVRLAMKKTWFWLQINGQTWSHVLSKHLVLVTTKQLEKVRLPVKNTSGPVLVATDWVEMSPHTQSPVSASS